MKTWNVDTLTIYETEFDYDLHVFDVYNNGKFLGTIYPASVEDMQHCVAEFDNGVNPIEAHWEDGNGNTLNYEGWE